MVSEKERGSDAWAAHNAAPLGLHPTHPSTHLLDDELREEEVGGWMGGVQPKRLERP
eukprot:gene32313-6762_t